MKQEEYEEWKVKMDAPLPDELGTLARRMFNRDQKPTAVRTEAQRREDAETFLALHGGR